MAKKNVTKRNAPSGADSASGNFSDFSKKGPVKAKSVITQIIARQGIGRDIASAAIEEAWNSAVGKFFAGQTRTGNLKNGTLEVFVKSPVISQELSFRIPELTKLLNAVAADKKIKRIKFSVQ